jgi:hypothetical protein
VPPVFQIAANPPILTIARFLLPPSLSNSTGRLPLTPLQRRTTRAKPRDHASSVARTRRQRYDVHFDRDSPGVIAVEYVYTSRLVIR